MATHDTLEVPGHPRFPARADLPARQRHRRAGREPVRRPGRRQHRPAHRDARREARLLAAPRRRRRPARNRAPGFLEPVTDHADQYAFLEPEGEVFYYTWPLMLRCTEPVMPEGRRLRAPEDWTAGTPSATPRAATGAGRRAAGSSTTCSSTHCGDDPPSPCPLQGKGRRRQGARPTRTSTCTTRSSRRRHGAARFGPGNGTAVITGCASPACRCGRSALYRHVTLRQDRRFITHTLNFVSFERGAMPHCVRVPARRRSSSAPTWSSSTTTRTRSPTPARTAPTPRQTWETDASRWRPTGRRPGPGRRDAQDGARHLRRRVRRHRQRWSATTTSSSHVGSDQRARERTLIWSGAGDLRYWRLDDVPRRRPSPAERHGAVQVLDDAKAKLDDFGFSDLLVVENFPVALVAYGYTRLGRAPVDVMLRPFPAPKSAGKRTRRPCTARRPRPRRCSSSSTPRGCSPGWSSNGMLNAGRRPCRTALGRRPGPPPRPKAAAARWPADHPEAAELCLAAAHARARAHPQPRGALRLRRGHDGEYLIPEPLTFGLFADIHQEFTLGALVSLVEHRLTNGSTPPGTAPAVRLGPPCGRHDGACAACLHLAFGCNQFNEHLDRAVLFGTPPRRTSNGLDIAFWELLPPLP